MREIRKTLIIKWLFRAILCKLRVMTDELSEEKMITIAFRVAPSLLEKVDAARGKQPKSEFFRDAIDAYLSGQSKGLPSAQSEHPLTDLIEEFCDAARVRFWFTQTESEQFDEHQEVVNLLNARVDRYRETIGEARYILTEKELSTLRKKGIPAISDIELTEEERRLAQEGLDQLHPESVRKHST